MIFAALRWLDGPTSSAADKEQIANLGFFMGSDTVKTESGSGSGQTFRLDKNAGFSVSQQFSSARCGTSRQLVNSTSLRCCCCLLNIYCWRIRFCCQYFNCTRNIDLSVASLPRRRPQAPPTPKICADGKKCTLWGILRMI